MNILTEQTKVQTLMTITREQRYAITHALEIEEQRLHDYREWSDDATREKMLARADVLRNLRNAILVADAVQIVHAKGLGVR